MKADYDELMSRIRVEFRDDTEDRLEMIDNILGLARDGGGLDTSRINEIRRIAHSLKGSGGSVGYPLVSMVAHRFEDYLSDLADATSNTLSDLQCFADRLRDVIDLGPEPAGIDEAEFIRGLPAKPGFDVDDVVKTDVEVMLVMPVNAASRFVDDQLKACGYRLFNVTSPFAAIEFAVRGRPDLIFASAVLDGISGVDLICALRAMPATRRLPVALLTSFAPDHASLVDLPDGVPIIRKGHQFGEDLADALASCGII
jgi:CheY-like chemotaxis protein/HPt (histidine-containing phosphotransfer) domain-containing protein